MTSFVAHLLAKFLPLLALVSAGAASFAEAADQPVFRILNVGDSLSRRGHLQVLQESFVAAGISNYEFVGPVEMEGSPKPVHRLAYGGNTLQDMLNGRTVKGEVRKSLIAALPEYRPDLVLLMGGTNNIVKLKKGDDLQQVQQAWSAILECIRKEAPGAVVFVASVPPVHSAKEFSERKHWIDEFNAWLSGEISRRADAGEKIIYVDLNGLISDADFMADGLHLNASGDAKIGKSWFAAIMAAGSAQR